MNPEAAAYFPDALVNAIEVHVPSSTSPSVAAPSKIESVPCLAITSPILERSDEDLLSLVSNGSKEALSILFQRHARPVFNVARRILRDASEAEDLRQEVFLFLFQKAQLFDASKGTASSWIIQVTYHRAINRRQYLSIRQHYNTQELNEEQIDANCQRSFINEIDARALLNQLRDELSAEQQHTLELHFFEGYSLREIAEKTSQTLGSIRHHYYRGLERLRANVFPRKDA